MSEPEQEKPPGSEVRAPSRTSNRKVSFKGVEFRIKLGAVFPNFICETTQGTNQLYELLDQWPSWTVLMSHPGDFDPVCTTELAASHRIHEECKERGVKLLGLACDTVEEHHEWAKDIVAVSGGSPNTELSFPLIADKGRHLSAKLGMLSSAEVVSDEPPLGARALFVVGPDKTNRFTLLYPANAGRNFPEVLRALDSLLFTEHFHLATPAAWKPGERLLVPPDLSNEDAQARFGSVETQALPSGKRYLRTVECPRTPERNALPERVPQVFPTDTVQFRIKLGVVLPNVVDLETTDGKFTLHQLLERDLPWTVFFACPKDFTPVCTTELVQCHELLMQFRHRGVKLLAVSCDSVSSHRKWQKDVLVAARSGASTLGFPIIADERRFLVDELGMTDAAEMTGQDPPAAARALFIVGPDKAIHLATLYPATMGRDFAEVLRIVDALLVGQPDVPLATPANWQAGGRLLVSPHVPPEEAQTRFGDLEIKTLPSDRQYLRYVDCPGAAGAALSRQDLPSSPPVLEEKLDADIGPGTGLTAGDEDMPPLGAEAEERTSLHDVGMDLARKSRIYCCCTK